MDRNQMIDEFGDCIEEHAAGVFIGAGLSVPAGFPSWANIMKPIVAELGVKNDFDLPQMAQWYQNDIPGGRERLLQQITSAIRSVTDPVPTPCHQLVAQLPIDSIWTTNYDSLIEDSNPSALVLKADEELAQHTALRYDKRIFKMHGTISKSNDRKIRLAEESQIVISKEDFERYSITHPRMWSLLHAHFLTRSFLLIGLGFTDPNLEHIFKLIRLMRTEGTRKHYAVIKRPSAASQLRPHELKVAELEQIGIQTVEIADYSEIEAILRQLVSRSRPYRVFVSGSPVGVDTGGGAISYPPDEIPSDLMSFAKTLGGFMASTCDRVMAAGGVGAQVGYEMARQLKHQGKYDPDCLVLIRRYRDEVVDYPNLRIGKLFFVGETPNEPFRAMI